jgi:hypothetical protein
LEDMENEVVPRVSVSFIARLGVSEMAVEASE